MSRKGRVSNELVAASCAAVLAVYAAGYWRTRDVAQRMESQGRERRQARTTTQVTPPLPAAQVPTAPAVPEPAPAPAPELPVTAAADANPAPEAEPPPTAPPPKVSPPPTPPTPTPAKPVAPQVAAAPKPPAVEPEQANAAAPKEVYSVPLDAVPLDDMPDLAKVPTPPPGTLPEGFQGWRDGTYTGWGTSYHGDIEATVTIEGGRIVRSGIATCATRYPCDVISTILYQPIERQSPEVDHVSRATESADAYYYALVEALKQAEVTAEPAAAPSN